MAHQVMWEKCAIYDENGKDTILSRGELLPDKGVDEFQLSVLTSIGAVTFREDPPEKPGPEETVHTEGGTPSNPLAGLSPSFTPEQTGDPNASTPPADRPANSANKPEWVNYAVSHGMGRNKADSMSKDALINWADNR